MLFTFIRLFIPYYCFNTFYFSFFSYRLFDFRVVDLARLKHRHFLYFLSTVSWARVFCAKPTLHCLVSSYFLVIKNSLKKQFYKLITKTIILILELLEVLVLVF